MDLVKDSPTNGFLRDSLRNTNEENLEYLEKKNDVIFFLGKFLYGVVIFVLLGYGLYFMMLSNQTNINKDEMEFNRVSGIWNQSYSQNFAKWNISLMNDRNASLYFALDKVKMHEYDDAHSIYYDANQFVIENMVGLTDRIRLNKVTHGDSLTSGYNLTTNLTLKITIPGRELPTTLNLNNIDLMVRSPNGLNHKDCVSRRGLWNYEENLCFRYFLLRQLCIIINQDSETNELYYDYKSFKCNGYNNWYETLTVFPWAIPSYDPSFDDIRSKTIKVYLSTNRDPYVFAMYNGTLHFSNLNKSYSLAGIWLILSAILLISIPVLFYFKGTSINEEYKRSATLTSPKISNKQPSITQSYRP